MSDMNRGKRFVAVAYAMAKMGIVSARSDRFDLALKHRKTLGERPFSVRQVAACVGMPHSHLSLWKLERIQETERWKAVANALEVDPEWLRSGKGTVPAFAVSHTAVVATGAPLRLVGRASAGDGAVSRYLSAAEDFPIPSHWRVVEVEGMSAYPVATATHQRGRLPAMRDSRRAT